MNNFNSIISIVGLLLLFCCSALGSSNKTNDLQEDKLAHPPKPVKSGDFPHQVSIQENGRHLCGGSLITPRHVLTAAHCISPYIEEPNFLTFINLTVEVGSVYLNKGKVHEIRRLSQKDDFDSSVRNPFVLPNDIGVITLKNPVKESASVKRIALPDENLVIPPKSPIIISGFGNASLFLKKTEVYTITQIECKKYFERTANKTILSSHICTNRGPGYGTCQGDSGGPLIYKNKIVGIVSAGDTKCDAGFPDVHTRVSSYLKYIKYEINYKFPAKEPDFTPAKAINIDSLNMKSKIANKQPEAKEITVDKQSQPKEESSHVPSVSNADSNQNPSIDRIIYVPPLPPASNLHLSALKNAPKILQRPPYSLPLNRIQPTYIYN
ncbi:hypothetical protein QAD02_006535 [Eretmocerus hayati]|uniref:Uncharacterized protein n=1 Tax=Eretmocerus hayati TaxID=131215 RepID=A0ACC2N1L8_9HYME|nr:hypothetical protein QAD02_006535 [Eretmocerus hayati]